MTWQGILKRKLNPNEVQQYASLHEKRRKKNIADKSKSWEEKRDALRVYTRENFESGTALPEMQLMRWLRFDSLHPQVKGMLSREFTKLSEGLDKAPTEEKYMAIIDELARMIQTTKHEWMNYSSEDNRYKQGKPDPKGLGSAEGLDFIKGKLKEFGFLPEGGKF